MFVQFRIDWETVRYRYNTIRNDTTRVSIQLPPLVGSIEPVFQLYREPHSNYTGCCIPAIQGNTYLAIQGAGSGA